MGVGQMMFARPYTQTNTDITVDTHTEGTFASVNNPSFSFTTSGTNRLLIVVTGVWSGRPAVTAVKYNNVSLTRVQFGFLNGASIFYLVGPALGANTLAFTKLAGLQCEYVVVSFNGVNQSGNPEATGSNINAAAGVALSGSITTVANRSLVIGGNYNASAISSSGAGANTVVVYNHLGTTAADNLKVIAASSPKTPAGSVTINMNADGSGSQQMLLQSWAPA